MGINAIEVSDDTQTPNTPTMNMKPDSPQTPSNIKTRRKLLRAESLEDLHVLAIKKKPSMKKKKKAPTAAATTKTTINEEMTTASGDRHDSTDGAAGATATGAVTGVKKSPKKIKKKVLKKSLTSEIITMSSPFTDSTTPEQIRGGNGGGGGGGGASGDLLLEATTTGKSATMGKKKKTKKSKIDVEAFHELNNRSTPN